MAGSQVGMDGGEAGAEVRDMASNDSAWRGGWTCGVCGCWVPNNTLHECGSTSSFQTGQAPVADQTDRLISAIERLIEVVERLEKTLPLARR